MREHRQNVHSSIRNLLSEPSRDTAKRTTTETVASRRHKTAVTTNAGLREYGSTKFGVTPGGGARAGTSLELVELILLSVQMAEE